MRRSNARGRAMDEPGASDRGVQTQGQDSAAGSLRRTISAILWRHQNGAKWRAIPADLGPWWRAAQTFIRWAHLGVWERLLRLAQERGVQLGMTFLDGTSIRAHQKAAGAEKRGPPARRAMSVRRLAARGAATAVKRHPALRATATAR